MSVICDDFFLEMWKINLKIDLVTSSDILFLILSLKEEQHWLDRYHCFSDQAGMFQTQLNYVLMEYFVLFSDQMAAMSLSQSQRNSSEETHLLAFFCAKTWLGITTNLVFRKVFFKMQK